MERMKEIEIFGIPALFTEKRIDHDTVYPGMYRYWYEYKLTVIDRFGNPDVNYPTLPGIKSKKQFKAGSVVAVALPYGDLTPAIIGEVEL